MFCILNLTCLKNNTFFLFPNLLILILSHFSESLHYLFPELFRPQNYIPSFPISTHLNHQLFYFGHLQNTSNFGSSYHFLCHLHSYSEQCVSPGLPQLPKSFARFDSFPSASVLSALQVEYCFKTVFHITYL